MAITAIIIQVINIPKVSINPQEMIIKERVPRSADASITPITFPFSYGGIALKVSAESKLFITGFPIVIMANPTIKNIQLKEAPIITMPPHTKKTVRKYKNTFEADKILDFDNIMLDKTTKTPPTSQKIDISKSATLKCPSKIYTERLVITGPIMPPSKCEKK